MTDLYEILAVPSRTPHTRPVHAVRLIRRHPPGYRRSRLVRRLGLDDFPSLDRIENEDESEDESGSDGLDGSFDYNSAEKESTDDEKTPTQTRPHPSTYHSSPAPGRHLPASAHHPINASTRSAPPRRRLRRLVISKDTTTTLRQNLHSPHPYPHLRRFPHLYALLRPRAPAVDVPVRKRPTLVHDLDMDFCCRGDVDPADSDLLDDALRTNTRSRLRKSGRTLAEAFDMDFCCSGEDATEEDVDGDGSDADANSEPGLTSDDSLASTDESFPWPASPGEPTPTVTMFSRKGGSFA